MTTEPERRLKAAEAALEDDRCHCGKVPELTYHIGCTTIHCERCGLWAVVADFEPEQVLKEWKIKVQ